MAVTLYVWPGKKPQTKLSVYCYAYVYPHFHQNWNLFVPAPKQNFSLCVKYKAGNKNQDWTDIFYRINSAHQNNRFGGNESILLAFSNTIRYYAGSVEEKSEMISDKNSNINFMMLEKMVRAYLENHEQQSISDLEIMVAIHSINKNSSHSHYYAQKN